MRLWHAEDLHSEFLLLVAAGWYERAVAVEVKERNTSQQSYKPEGVLKVYVRPCVKAEICFKFFYRDTGNRFLDNS